MCTGWAIPPTEDMLDSQVWPLNLHRHKDRSGGGESIITPCFGSDLHMAGAVAVSRGTPNPMADNDSLSQNGASKGTFLPSHPLEDSLSPNLTDTNSW